MKPSLCLNMIVKNEAANIERCLASVLPYVKAAVICDTGSTDDTELKILACCAAARVPVTITKAPFENFSQARNAAFAAAQLARQFLVPHCQFALLMDADMELVVEDKHAMMLMDANALSYDMMQKGGSISYANRRIVNLDWGQPTYIGVTHEYIDVPSAGMIKGAHFIDHADGSNRANKYVRDAQLLEDALKTEPDNGRYWYYLGNTYMDWGATDKTVLPYAAAAYKHRIEMGGWDEETHSAMMNLAFVQKMRDDGPGFVAWMLAAYNFRPQRVEPLYELAKYYREKGENFNSVMFAKQGLPKTRPDDLLFVNDYAYSHGCRYEYSVTGYYDEKERSRAFEVTDDLALDPSCPPDVRWSARSNLYWHTKPLSHYCKTFEPHKLDFTPPPGYTAMNPSVEACNGHITCNIRCVNYKIDAEGRYMIGPKECNDAPIETRNFICKLTPELTVQKSRELLWHRPEAQFPLVIGLEDIRLWRYHGELYFTATVREQSSWGQCQMVQGKTSFDIDDKFMTVTDWKVISDSPDGHEKNWMPMPSLPSSLPRFMYRLDTIIEPGAALKRDNFPIKVSVNDISGGSQLIPFKGGMIAVVHEAGTDPQGKRTYWHRFAWFTKEGELRRLSLPFVFLDRQIEFCAGLAYHPNHNDLLISFGVRDEEAYVAKIAIEEVAMMCWKFHED